MDFSFSRRRWINRLCWALNLLTLYREILPRVYYILEDLRSDKTRETDLSPWMTPSTRDNDRPSYDRILSPTIDAFKQETKPDFQAAMHGEAGFDTLVPATSTAPIDATGTDAPRVVAALSALTAELGKDSTRDGKDGASSTCNSGLRCVAKKIWRFFWDKDIVEEFGPPTEWLWE
ncbi:unnamed protein product [Ectocarpus fasciculatus]